MRLIKYFIMAALLGIGSSAMAQSGCGGQFSSGRVCANAGASQGLPSATTLSSLLDRNFGTTQGTVLNRGASLWTATVSPILGQNGVNGGAIILEGGSTGSSTIGVNSTAGNSVFNLPVGNGTNGFVLITDGSGNTSWVSNASGGTVQSVALSLPNIFSVTGSPVTSTGTLTASLVNQTTNFVWAGPGTGSAAAPTFRKLVGADLPNPSASTLGGIQSTTGTTHQWISTISTSGVPGLSQPAFTDISGTAVAAQIPTPTLSTIGGIKAINQVTSNWINSITTAGAPILSQPAFTDISGNASLSQLPSISNSSVLGNNSGGTAVPSALSASNVLDFIDTTQGDVLYRNGTIWTVLPPGTNGQILTTGGPAANPAWTTVSGTGTVTSVATNNGLTGGPITTTGTIGLASIATGNVLAYTGAGSGTPVATTASAVLDIIGSTTGNLLYRSSGSGWVVLAPGTNGQVLTQGASTPSWSSAGTLTNVTISAGAGISTSGTCTITTTGTCTVLLDLTHANTWSGIQSFNATKLVLNGSSSGTLVLNATAIAGTHTMTFPAVTDTVAVLGTAGQVVAGGVTFTSANLGTISSGTTTINCGTVGTQFLTDNGAFTLAAPAADSGCAIQITNGASAGTITFSGFTVGSNTGATLDTTNGHKFMINILRINGSSIYNVVAQQ